MSPAIASRFAGSLYRPILASILKSRTACLAITGTAVLQLGLAFAGLPGWRSPIHALLGLPDPGCGLTRAIVALLRGDWLTSLTFHAFASLFVVALALIALAAILPSPAGAWLTSRVEMLERWTGLTAILLLGLVIYWLLRLLIWREHFIILMAG